MFGKREQQFYLVSPDKSLQDILRSLWPDKVNWTCFDKGRAAIEKIFNDPPDLLVVDDSIADMSGMELVKLVKSENVYRQVPVVICLENGATSFLNSFAQVEVDDFILRPFSTTELQMRLGLTWYRSSRALDANPLSKLPGNTSIIQRIQEMIETKDEFALGYLDLDNFKSFNDKYGFSRGDEILMMTARLLVNIIRSIAGVNGFVGHIGGDDFVFIVPIEQAEVVCKGIISNFDSIVPHFYDAEDRQTGYIRSTDRRGNVCDFPLMSVSIAVVLNTEAKLEHYGQAAHEAMNLKKKAKEEATSNYVLDRRKSP